MEAVIKSVVDAPVANLCVLAGLVFLAISVVGNISGKIQPGNPGRIAAGALGILLLGYGVATHSAGLDQRQVGNGVDQQSAPEPGERAFTQMRVDTDLLGGDYKGFDASTVDMCETECKRDGNCRAWTFVRAGVQGPQPRCYLKDVIPAASPNTCCVSGHLK